MKTYKLEYFCTPPGAVADRAYSDVRCFVLQKGSFESLILLLQFFWGVWVEHSGTEKLLSSGNPLKKVMFPNVSR